MNYDEFLNTIIDNGIAGAKTDYTEEQQREHLEGSIAGFEACRNKFPHELIEVYHESNEYANKAFFERDADKYWWFRCYQLEVEWVLNCISASMVNEGGAPLLPHLPTCNAMMAVSRILGVQKM